MQSRKEARTMQLTALRLTIAASAMLVAVTSASAQNMKAEIPFAFQVGGARMNAGTYEVVWQQGTVATLQIRNREDRNSVLAVPQVRNVFSTPGNDLRIAFLCTGGRCELSGLRTYEAQYA